MGKRMQHVPFIKREGNRYSVMVGENARHPMDEEKIK